MEYHVLTIICRKYHSSRSQKSPICTSLKTKPTMNGRSNFRLNGKGYAQLHRLTIYAKYHCVQQYIDQR